MRRSHLGSELVWREWTQAWEHRRHLESMRSHYLGLFMTAMLAVIALLANTVGDDPLSTTKSFLMFSGLVLGLNSLAATLYPAVARINRICRYYNEIILKIRDGVRGKYSSPVDLSEFREPPPAPRATVQSVPVFVLTTALVVCPLALAGAIVRAATVAGCLSVSTLACGLAFVGSLMIAGLVRWGGTVK